MRFDPSLRLNRLVVFRESEAVYDELFHPGVNILRGDNGGGKTTVADFVFFALGGEVRNWRPEALSCTYTYAEVALNGVPTTLRREVASASMRPMSIFWGDYEEAFTAPLERWQHFPFAARSARKSFSEALFEALGLPAVRSDQLESRLTMHQLLRLAYVDQTTPHDHLFYSDTFDRAITREAVGDLVTGVYDARLYELQFELRDLRVEYAAIEKELKAILAILDPDDHAIGVSFVEQVLHNRNVQRQEVYDRLSKLKSPEAPQPAASVDDQNMRNLREEASLQSATVNRLRGQASQLSLSIADSDQFIAALELKVKSLAESSAISEVLGPASFDVCPVCFAALPEAPDQGCRVCRQPYDTDQHRKNTQRVRFELQLQIDESRRLQAERHRELAAVSMQLPAEIAKSKELQARLNELATRAMSRIESAEAELYRQLGYLDNEIEALERKKQLAARIDGLSDRKASISSRISLMEDEIAARINAQSERRGRAASIVSEITAEILRRDLPREEGFKDASHVSFSFSTDDIAVDGKKVFAASSMVLLKNAFHLALTLASTRDPEFRYPRFVLFDNVEDKGMEEERSHNFQRLIVDYSANAEVEHQIIFTTSKIAPELEDERFTVGRFYALNEKSLQFSGAPSPGTAQMHL